MKQRVAVAISGGIDSLYSAYLLIQAGHDVTGIHFETGYGTFPASPCDPRGQVINHGSSEPNTLSAMSSLSAQLGIPIHIMDAQGIFEQSVVSYFVEKYQNGETPNPCLICNPLIKFGVVMDFARRIGSDALATGHYARVTVDDHGNARLLKGWDEAKDQSYFLAFLKQDQLKHSLFPLGELTKTEITCKAQQAGLKPVSSKESQDICFIPKDYKAFLLNRPGFRYEKGDITTSDGVKIGVHNGLHSFTIGQRRGINCPAPFPYYVTRIDTSTNTLIVGPKHELAADRVTVKGVSWINEPLSFPFETTTRIRYSHKGVGSTLTMGDNGQLNVTCHAPVSSVTRGQGAVFYKDDEVLGGGWIA